jgi:hypothetical protein
MTIDNPKIHVATDSSPEEVERYGVRGYGMRPEMPRQQAFGKIDD